MASMMLRSSNLVCLPSLLAASLDSTQQQADPLCVFCAGRKGRMPSQRCRPQPGCALPCRRAEVHRQGGPQQGPAVLHQRRLPAVPGRLPAWVSQQHAAADRWPAREQQEPRSTDRHQILAGFVSHRGLARAWQQQQGSPGPGLIVAVLSCCAVTLASTPWACWTQSTVAALSTPRGCSTQR